MLELLTCFVWISWKIKPSQRKNTQLRASRSMYFYLLAYQLHKFLKKWKNPNLGRKMVIEKLRFYRQEARGKCVFWQKAFNTKNDLSLILSTWHSKIINKRQKRKSNEKIYNVIILFVNTLKENIKTHNISFCPFWLAINYDHVLLSCL